MNRKAILIAVILLIAAGLITALLLSGGREEPTVGTAGQTQSSGTITDIQAELGETTVPLPTDGENTEATAESKPQSGGSQIGEGSEPTQGSRPTQSTQPTQTSQPNDGFGVEDWTGSTETTQENTQPSQSTEETKESEPKGDLGVEDWEGDSTQSTDGQKPQLTDMTWSQFQNLTPEQREQFYDALGHATFTAWKAEAKKAYDEGREVITGNSNINLNDYLK